jgi:hypothetical protein
MFYDTQAREGSLLPGVEEWAPTIAATEQRLGLSGKSALERRIYRMLLPWIR